MKLLDGTIIGVAAKARSGVGANFKILLNGAAIGGGDFAITGANDYTSNVRDHNFTAGDTLQIFCDNTAKALDVTVIIITKWRDS